MVEFGYRDVFRGFVDEVCDVCFCALVIIRVWRLGICCVRRSGKFSACEVSCALRLLGICVVFCLLSYIRSLDEDNFVFFIGNTWKSYLIAFLNLIYC